MKVWWYFSRCIIAGSLGSTLASVRPSLQTRNQAASFPQLNQYLYYLGFKLLPQMNSSYRLLTMGTLKLQREVNVLILSFQ